MTRRRRPTRETVPAPTPTLAEAAAEAHGRLAYSLGASGQASEPVPFDGPRLCGWCHGRDGLRAIREHKPCGQRSCGCWCGETASGSRGPSILENPEIRRAVRDMESAEQAANIFHTADPRDGSGVRVSQSPGMDPAALGMDPELAALLGSEETP